MKPIIFENLFDKLEQQNPNSLEEIHFHSDYTHGKKLYVLSFYPDEQEKVCFEECGYLLSGEWNREVLTNEQLEKCQQLLDKEITRIKEYLKDEQSQEELSDYWGEDNYSKFGVDRKNFF